MAQAADVDLDHILWAMPEWIEYMLPNRTITTSDEALDYFAMSPFWNQQSNNHTLRVQTVVQQSMDPNFKYGHAEEKLALHRFNAGFEYVIGHSNPPKLYVVHRRDVGEDGKRDNVTGVWFILDEKIYPSPNLYDVMANRLKNASFLIGSTFSNLSAAHPPSNPRIHPSWRSLPPTDPEREKSQAQSRETDTPSDPSSKPDEPVLPNFALLNALQSTRQALAGIDELARAPAPVADPHDELKRLEEEMMGVRAGAAPGQATNAARSVKSISIAPSGLAADRARDFGSSKAGTPGARLLGGVAGRTPGFAAPSPLTSQQGL